MTDIARQPSKCIVQPGGRSSLERFRHPRPHPTCGVARARGRHERQRATTLTPYRLFCQLTPGYARPWCSGLGRIATPHMHDRCPWPTRLTLEGPWSYPPSALIHMLMRTHVVQAAPPCAEKKNDNFTIGNRRAQDGLDILPSAVSDACNNFRYNCNEFVTILGGRPSRLPREPAPAIGTGPSGQS
jgi:hypothetical protein